MQRLIAPSLLSADFGNLQQDIEMINNSEADWFHVDVMDGNFVPNISFGMMLVSAMKKMAEKPLDVHLMIVEPQRYIEQFRESGADVITVHYEACTHLHRVIHQIKDTGANISLKPLSPDDQPVMITKPEFMRRMKEMQALQGMSMDAFPDSYNVVVNTNHALVAEKLLKMRSQEKKEEFVQHLYNLAMLNQGIRSAS